MVRPRLRRGLPTRDTLSLTLTAALSRRLRRHLGDISRRNWPKNRGFDTSRGWMYTGIGDQHTWKLANPANDLFKTACKDPGIDAYDLIYEDIMPNGATKAAGPTVDSNSSTWNGSRYILSGLRNPVDSGVFYNMYEHYKNRSLAPEGTSATLLNLYDGTVQNTDYVVKTVQSETVRHIESHAGDTKNPFFMYIGAPAMRTTGQQNNGQRQRVFELEESGIDSCDYLNVTNQPYPPNTSMAAMKTLTESNDQNWSTVYEPVINHFCRGRDAKSGEAQNTELMDKFNERFLSHAFATTVDDLLNATVDALHRSGLWENTMIVLTSDNGGQPYSTHFNWPLRGAPRPRPTPRHVLGS